MFATIYPLSLSPAYDISLWVDQLGIEKINIIEKEVHNAAGKGINVARTLHSFHIPYCALVLAGEDNREKYFSLLDQEKIRYEALFLPGATRENYHIFIPGQLGCTLARKGFWVNQVVISQVQSMLEKHVTADDLVIFGGRFPLGMDREDFLSICRTIHRLGAQVAVDSNSVDLQDLLEASPFLIKPNLEEMRVMSRRPLNTMEEQIALLHELNEQGIRHILLSMDEQGLLYSSLEGAWRVQVPKVFVQSTVGAGDCTLSGFLAGLRKSRSLQECACLAAAFGTASVMSEGTVPPTRENVSFVLRQTKAQQVR